MAGPSALASVPGFSPFGPMSRFGELAPVGSLPPGRDVELPGRGSTYVLDTGERVDQDRPTLVLLHALACTAALTWYPVIDALATKGRVVTLDQRWHGRGIRSDRFTLEDCADDVAALGDVLGLDRFVVVGYSMGSLVAQLAARAHPDRVAGMVLCAGTTGFKRNARERIALDALNGSMATLRPGAGRRPEVDGDPVGRQREWLMGQFRSTSPGAVGRAVAEVGKFDSSGWIADLTLPTSVVVTATDQVIPARRQHWMARQIAGAATYEVQAGHGACVLAADEFRSGLMPAVASVTSRVRP
ncbi:alpha/beta fold hydrolase [Rhodococcus sp. NPDC058532]|uniref:alpha/beta fold hydrolase n=1 Tax=Rhodococcus sp. NPDC058532 TaxID=3346540 RepID=UPI003658C4D2